MQDWELDFIKKSSISLSDGGDTHIHPYGMNESDFTITTRIPLGDGLYFTDHLDGKDIDW